jgi:hypothetical protein
MITRVAFLSSNDYTLSDSYLLVKCLGQVRHLPSTLQHRAHKTYINERVRAMIDKLPLAKKRDMNEKIVERNLQREYKRARRGGGDLTIAEPSDDKSEVEYMWEDDEVIRRETAKRRREEEAEEEEREGKRVKNPFHYGGNEQDDRDGFPVEEGFHESLLEAAKVKVSLPLHLFTRSALEFFNQKGSSLPTTKISAKTMGQKATYLLDYEHPTVKAVIGKEDNLTLLLWIEAGINFVRWCEEVDPTGRSAKRWQDHFQFLAAHRNCHSHFKAVLKADIEAQNRYVGTPTIFNAKTLSDMVNRYVQEIEIQSQVQSQLQSRMAEWEAAQGARGTRQGGSQSKSSFRPEGGFPTSRKAHNDSRTKWQSACIRCGREGHKCGDCTATTLLDGKPCFIDKSGKAGSDLICRAFNFRGSAVRGCQHGTEWKHVCSFCGAAGHHALAFHCQKAPSGSA